MQTWFAENGFALVLVGVVALIGGGVVAFPPRDDVPPVAAAPSGGIKYATDRTFDQLVMASDGPVLVDFYADWCGPCRRVTNLVDQLSREEPAVQIVKVNIDDCPDLKRRFYVRTIPHLKVFRRGQEAASHQGVPSRAKLFAMLEL
jgi:thioredoxin 1